MSNAIKFYAVASVPRSMGGSLIHVTGRVSDSFRKHAWRLGGRFNSYFGAWVFVDTGNGCCDEAKVRAFCAEHMPPTVSA